MTKFEQGVEEYCKEAGMPKELRPQFKELVVKITSKAAAASDYAIPGAVGAAGGAGLGALLSLLTGSKHVGRNTGLGALGGAGLGVGAQAYDPDIMSKLLALLGGNRSETADADIDYADSYRPGGAEDAADFMPSGYQTQDQKYDKALEAAVAKITAQQLAANMDPNFNPSGANDGYAPPR